MILAVEDALSDAVARAIVLYAKIAQVPRTIGLQGAGYLKNKAEGLNRSAGAGPILLLTDLDTDRRCPLDLIREWVPGPLHANFLFRVAVMEIESWILADRDACAALLRVPSTRIPSDTDSIPKPKEFLVSLARLSSVKRLREEFVPRHGSTAAVGPFYNSRLQEFVREKWNPERASAASLSLRRTLARLTAIGEQS
jgi:hypothetical protein